MEDGHGRTRNVRELPKGYLEETLANRPQNFDSGKQRRVTCNKGCGQVLDGISPSAQAIHDKACPNELRFHEKILEMKATAVLSETLKNPPLPAAHDRKLSRQIEKEEKRHMHFQIGKGFYKPSRNEQQREERLLLPPDTVVVPHVRSKRSGK